MTEKTNWELLQLELSNDFRKSFRKLWDESDKSDDDYSDIFGGLYSEAEELLDAFREETMSLIEFAIEDESLNGSLSRDNQG